MTAAVARQRGAETAAVARKRDAETAAVARAAMRSRRLRGRRCAGGAGARCGDGGCAGVYTPVARAAETMPGSRGRAQQQRLRRPRFRKWDAAPAGGRCGLGAGPGGASGLGGRVSCAWSARRRKRSASSSGAMRRPRFGFTRRRGDAEGALSFPEPLPQYSRAASGFAFGALRASALPCPCSLLRASAPPREKIRRQRPKRTWHPHPRISASPSPTLPPHPPPRSAALAFPRGGRYLAFSLFIGKARLTGPPVESGCPFHKDGPQTWPRQTPPNS